MIDRAADEEAPWLFYLNVDPAFDPIRRESEVRRDRAARQDSSTNHASARQRAGRVGRAAV